MKNHMIANLNLKICVSHAESFVFRSMKIYSSVRNSYRATIKKCLKFYVVCLIATFIIKRHKSVMVRKNKEPQKLFIFFIMI